MTSLPLALALFVSGPLPQSREQVEMTAVSAHIHQIAPRVSAKRVRYLAREFVRAGHKYDVDPSLMASIAMVESRFRPGLEAHWINKGKPTTDRGLMQVNQVWVDRWSLDPDKLRDDDAYNIMVAARILKIIKKQFGQNEKNWFTRYNSSWPPARAKYTKVLYPQLPLSIWMTVAPDTAPTPRTGLILASVRL